MDNMKYGDGYDGGKIETVKIDTNVEDINGALADIQRIVEYISKNSHTISESKHTIIDINYNCMDKLSDFIKTLKDSAQRINTIQKSLQAKRQFSYTSCIETYIQSIQQIGNLIEKLLHILTKLASDVSTPSIIRHDFQLDVNTSRTGTQFDSQIIKYKDTMKSVHHNKRELEKLYFKISK